MSVYAFFCAQNIHGHGKEQTFACFAEKGRGGVLLENKGDGRTPGRSRHILRMSGGGEAQNSKTEQK